MEENIEDYFEKCKGEESARLGIYHFQRACRVDADIFCSKRYEEDVPGIEHKYYCSYRKEKDS